MSDKGEKVKDFCEMFNKDCAVIFFVDDKEMGYTFYGKDKKWRDFVKRFANKLDDLIAAYIKTQC